jgi:hypothetical protein
MKLAHFCLQAFTASVLGLTSTTADIALPSQYQLQNIDLSPVPVIGNTFIADWELADPLTGEAIPDGILPVHYSILLLGFDSDVGDFLPIGEFLSESSDAAIPAGLTDGYAELAMVISAFNDNNELLDTSDFTPVNPGSAVVYVRDATDCIELLDLYLNARDACAAKDCSDLKTAMEQAYEDFQAALEAAEIEKARREQLTSQIPALQKQSIQCYNDLDQLAEDLQQAKEDLIADLQAHFDARAVAASPNNQAALPIAQSDGSPSSGTNVNFQIAPGVYGSIDVGFTPTANELANMTALMENDIQSKFANTPEYQNGIAGMNAIQSAIDAKEAELAQIEEDLAAVVSSGNHNEPWDQDARAKEAVFLDARTAYEECAAEKKALCDHAERLARELERCEKEAEIGRELGGAQEDEEAADDAIADAEEDLQGIPESIKGGDSPAGSRARDAKDCIDLAMAEKAAAEAHINEAKAKIAAGDLTGAAAAAQKAKEAAERARQLAVDAKIKAKQALTRSNNEVRDNRAAALRLQERQLKEFERWQKRRKACIEYLTWQALSPIADQFTPDELADAASVLEDLMGLGGDLRTAMEIWGDNPAGSEMVNQAIKDLKGQLENILGKLQPLKDAFDGFNDLYDKISQMAASLSMITDDPDLPGQGQKFGQWLESVGFILDETVGNIPILQFVTGYFSFLVDGYFAALEGIENIKETEFNALVALDQGGLPSCGTILNWLCEGMTIPQMAQAFMAGFEDATLNSLSADMALFIDWLEAKIGIALNECCEEQVKTPPPPVTYSEWIDAGNFVTPVHILQPMSDMDVTDITDPLADSSGEGIINYVQFYFDIDPTAYGFWPVRPEWLQWETGQMAMALVFQRLAGVTGVQTALEWSPDMSPDSWMEIPGVIDFYPQTDGTESIHFFPTNESLRPINPSDGFYRLKLKWAP